MRYAVLHHIGPEKKDFWNIPSEILDFDGVLTFDGVYESVLRHVSLLEGRQVILFPSLVGDGKERLLSFKEAVSLRDYLGCDIGWHTWTHRDLTRISDEQVKREIRPYFEWMDILAYPYGNFDDRVSKLAKECGYRKAFSTTQGEKGNDFAVPREYL